LSLTIQTIRTEGLGNSTYVASHDGTAVVVDPQRDIDRFESVVDESGSALRLVLETHLHNDYVSGGRDLARRRDAELVMPAGAAPAFRHRPAFHHEDIELGSLVIRPIHTPGHTPEHTSYLFLVDDEPVAVFTGGSLLVGSAGRSDLLGPERAETLARLQHGSVHRLARLPTETMVCPTHGAGSFCTTSAAGRVTSTIGDEVATNPVLTYEDEDAFVKGELSGLVPYPSYYRQMGALNLIGLTEPTLDVPVVDSVPEGVTVVDGRPMEKFAAGHIPGALGIGLRDSFGTWVGWLTEHNTPLALVLDESQDRDEALRQLVRIGYDDIRGIIRTGPDHGSGFSTVDIETFVSALEDEVQVLDVRAPDEWEKGIVPDSVLSYLPDLAVQTPPDLDRDRPVWVMCASGLRATTAASILEGRGFEPIVLVGAGATNVLARTSKK
jgi:hydroxyacylglutathione hydrolase